MSRVVQRLLKKLYFFCAIALIILAVLVQLGRSFSHMLSDYPDELGAYLSERIGLELSLGAIRADWHGLKPVLQLYEVRLASGVDNQILALNHANLQLDLWGSLIRGRLHWDTISLRGGEMKLVQLPDGRWNLAGLPRGQRVDMAAGHPGPDDFFGLFLLGTQVRFYNTHFTFQFTDDHSVKLFSPSVLLENTRNFHRLAIDLDIDDSRESVRLVVEGQGNPRNPRQFRTQGYLQLRAIPTAEPLGATAALLLGNTEQRVQRSSGTLDASIWFTSRPQGEGFDLRGQLRLGSLSLPQAARPLLLHRLETDITGHWLRSGEWSLVLQGLNALWDDSRLEDTQIALSSGGLGSPVQLNVKHLDVRDWIQMLEANQIFGEGQLQEVVRTLAPRGELHNVQLTVPLTDLNEWQLQANLRSVAVDAWRGVPGLTGVDGWLEASRRGGRIDLDSSDRFSMYYPAIYARPMFYQRARGQVAWWLQPERNKIYVNSGPLILANADGDTHEEALGYLWLSLPWQRNSGDIDLYLFIGARDMSASLHRKYVPTLVPETLHTWLDRSIGANNPGQASDGSFVFRGTLNTPGAMARTHQLQLSVENAELDYHPDWPPVNNLAGQLLLNDNELTAVIEQGQIYNSQLEQVTLGLSPNPRGKQPLLRIEGDVRGLASDGLRVLRESLLRQYVGKNMDSWYMHGDMLARVDLAIPLGPGDGGGYQRLDIAIKTPTMALDNFGVELTQVEGSVHYTSGDGISSSGLSARLFDKPLRIDISSHTGTAQLPQTLIELETQIDSDNLFDWLQRPELRFLEGTTGVSAKIELTHNPRREDETPEQDDLLAAISITSDLDGMVAKLPGRYGKTAGVVKPLTLNMIAGRQTALLDARYGEDLHGIFQFDRVDNQLLNANLALGAEARLRDSPQLLLSGYLDDLRMEPWQALLDQYRQFSSSSQVAGPLFPDLADLPPLRAEVILASHQLGPLQLKDLALEASRKDDNWQLAFSNDALAGRLQLAETPQPLQLSLDYVRINRPEPSPKPDLLPAELALQTETPGLDPRGLPLADVVIDALYIDGDNYGKLSFKMRPDSEGMLFDDLRADIRAVHIRGQEPESGAQIYWRRDPQGRQHTFFTGLLQAGDLADVMRQWQQPVVLESREASYLTELDWPGAPHDFALEALQGVIGINIRDGRFTRTPAGGSEGLLRLFAVLNFDSLARRLRLDFSDLYQSGLAYDEILGRVAFDGGTLNFVEPLLVRSPSSRMQLTGSINLIEETFDARLVATLPVAGNLTFLTALAAGLPAAAGVFLVSRLFEKQVDQATSISYTIIGDWNDPQVKFDRLFEGDSGARTQPSAPATQE